MTDNDYRKIVQKLVTAITDSTKIIMSAIQEEYKVSMSKIYFNNISNIFKNYADIEKNKALKNKNIAIICSGDPEITVQILLGALRNDINIKLITSKYHIINTCIFALFEEVMKEQKIPNKYLSYDANINERELTGDFDKVIYLGSHYDYENFKYFWEKDNVLFWNDNIIKIAMPRAELKEEYKDIQKYCYVNNIEVEVYDEQEELFEEVNEGENVIIYSSEIPEKFPENFKPRILKFNEFKADDFKFNVNDLILALDFSNKM